MSNLAFSSCMAKLVKKCLDECEEYEYNKNSAK